MKHSEEDRFNIEVIKLLLQIAWSDDVLDERERNLIKGAARSWEVPEPELQALLEKLDRGAALPAPDLQLLRSRPDATLEAARALIAVDGRVDEEEQSVLAQLESMLKE